MAKGNPRITVRFTPEELAEMEEAILCTQEYSGNPLADVSAFVRKAVAEKLAHRRRSNGGKRAKVPPHLKPLEGETLLVGLPPVYTFKCEQCGYEGTGFACGNNRCSRFVPF